jgi:hypothetical protein
MMVAMALLTLAMGLGMSGWLFMVRGEKRNSVQAELDMDVRKTIEQLRSKLRLSNLGRIVFYRPPGVENFTAISFPLAIDNDGDGLIEMENGTNIIWDQTIIYHVWNQTPEQLRRTTFSPRDNTLTEAQVRKQLADVVAAGNGSSALGGTNASTQVVFANLFDWKLWPKGSRFDSYSSTLKRELVLFGSVVVTPGVHTLSFRTTGKNPSSSGYKVGLDYVRASPSGSDREAEWQSYLTVPSTLAPIKQYMTQGSWSDNYQLLFPAATTNQQIQLAIENDCWEETTFRFPGNRMDSVVLDKKTYGSLEENFLKMDGNSWTWSGELQIPLGIVSNVPDNEYDKCAVRVLMKGANILDGGIIAANGQCPWVRLASPAGRKTRIKALCIGKVDDSGNYSTAMNLVPGSVRGISYSEEFEGLVGNYLDPIFPLYQISRSNTYAVTFYVDALGPLKNGGITYRDDPSGKTHCYVLTNAAIADVYETNWNGRATLSASSRIPVLYDFYTWYPAEASYVSGIFDTTKEDPAYREMLWNQSMGGSGYADTPSGTTLRMQVRTGADPYLADAPPWTNVPAISTSPGSLTTLANGRYVQFRALFGSDAWSTAILRNVKIRWLGAPKMVDVSAMVTRGPEYGEFEVLLDGTNLYKGVRIDLSIFKDVTGFGGKQSRMTSSMMAEVEPRNSEK